MSLISVLLITFLVEDELLKRFENAKLALEVTYGLELGKSGLEKVILADAPPFHSMVSYLAETKELFLAFPGFSHRLLDSSTLVDNFEAGVEPISVNNLPTDCDQLHNLEFASWFVKLAIGDDADMKSKLLARLGHICTHVARLVVQLRQGYPDASIVLCGHALSGVVVQLVGKFLSLSFVTVASPGAEVLLEPVMQLLHKEVPNCSPSPKSVAGGFGSSSPRHFFKQINYHCSVEGTRNVVTDFGAGKHIGTVVCIPFVSTGSKVYHMKLEKALDAAFERIRSEILQFLVTEQSRLSSLILPTELEDNLATLSNDSNGYCEQQAASQPEPLSPSAVGVGLGYFGAAVGFIAESVVSGTGASSNAATAGALVMSIGEEANEGYRKQLRQSRESRAQLKALQATFQSLADMNFFACDRVPWKSITNKLGSYAFEFGPKYRAYIDKPRIELESAASMEGVFASLRATV